MAERVKNLYPSQSVMKLEKSIYFECLKIEEALSAMDTSVQDMPARNGEHSVEYTPSVNFKVLCQRLYLQHTMLRIENITEETKDEYNKLMNTESDVQQMMSKTERKIEVRVAEPLNIAPAATNAVDSELISLRSNLQRALSRIAIMDRLKMAQITELDNLRFDLNSTKSVITNLKERCAWKISEFVAAAVNDETIEDDEIVVPLHYESAAIREMWIIKTSMQNNILRISRLIGAKTEDPVGFAMGDETAEYDALSAYFELVNLRSNLENMVYKISNIISLRTVEKSEMKIMQSIMEQGSSIVQSLLKAENVERKAIRAVVAVDDKPQLDSDQVVDDVKSKVLKCIIQCFNILKYKISPALVGRSQNT